MLTLANLSLGLISLLLLLTLFDVELPTLGQARYLLDRDEPLIIVNWQEHFETCPDLDRCCFYALNQVECLSKGEDSPLAEVEGKADWLCQSGETGLRYFLNRKAYLYCQQQPWR